MALAEDTGLSPGAVQTALGWLCGRDWVVARREYAPQGWSYQLTGAGVEEAITRFPQLAPRPVLPSFEPPPVEVWTVSKLQRAVDAGAEPPWLLATVRRALRESS